MEIQDPTHEHRALRTVPSYHSIISVRVLTRNSTTGGTKCGGEYFLPELEQQNQTVGTALCVCVHLHSSDSQKYQISASILLLWSFPRAGIPYTRAKKRYFFKKIFALSIQSILRMVTMEDFFCCCSSQISILLTDNFCCGKE